MIDLGPLVEQEQSLWNQTTPEPLGPVLIDHIVDRYKGYPSEIVTFSTRLTVRKAVANLTLRISLPEGLQFQDYGGPAAQPALLPRLESSGSGTHYLAWSLAGALTPGTVYEVWVQAVIKPTTENVTLSSEASLTSEAEGVLAAETAPVMVRPKGSYLRHLPSIYERDELMGRFLMLFESFWAPLENQIDNFHYYLDPRLTPAAFLPWLAGWLDLELDERWPEARLRQLLRWAIALHRSRGTKWGILKYLEIYTGQPARIIENRAKNFELGTGAKLGPGIALGKGNQPHTFRVILRLPPVEAPSKKERERQEALRRRTIESIIEMQAPAHTLYTLTIEPLTPGKSADGGRAKAKPISKEQAELAAQAAIWFKLDE
jgi:phage tail-like protein